MGSRLTIPVPRGYSLARDACSYGYFLLEPNHWDPRSRTFTRVLDLRGLAARVAINQPGDHANPARPGRPGGAGSAELIVRADRALPAPERREAVAQITRMLRLDEPDEVIREFHKVDPRWKRLGRGRLFRSPTLFEDIIKTVTSCNVHWPSTIIMNRRLCQVVGRPAPTDGPGPTHAFPTPQRLSRVRAATLRARCRTGYRDARIIELARLFSTGTLSAEWFEDPATPDDAIHEALLDLPGIGPYAAANIMQLLGRYHRLPLDTESLRHGRSILRFRGPDRRVMRRIDAHFKPFGAHAFRSYWFELWDFYEAKRGRSWTWERDTTGTTFTASQF